MSNTRTISVKLNAQIAGYQAAMKAAQDSTDKFAASVDRDGKRIDTVAGRMVRSAEVNRESWTTAGASITAFGAAGAVAFGLSAKAAMDWETAWTGVLKTVEGTDEQLSQLEADLRQMATELPATHEEIAAVAEAAGQLGVATPNVAAFTRVMIDLGETTNLTADEAATALARISNIMGTSATDVDRMGATIVDLGNNAATTEAEIVALGTRLAAAGSQAGLSEADVFAFASALTSVGVEAEAGGTAMSKVFTSIGDAVRDGGADLETFARVAGVSVEDFRSAFEDDAATAIGMFVEGMGRMAQSGESTTQVFDDLGLADERLKRSVLSLGSAQGLLNDQLEIANGAWESNEALVAEAEKRYDTTEAKIAIARNSLNEAAIVIGENLLPMLADLAGGVANVSQWFADLDPGVQRAITGLGGVATVTSLAAGGFLLMFPRMIETGRALRDIGAISPRVASGIGRIAGGATRVGGAVGIAAGVTWGLNEALTAAAKSSVNAAGGVAEVTKAMLDAKDAGGGLEDALFALGQFEQNDSPWSFAAKDLGSLEEALEAAEYSAKGFWGQLNGPGTGAFSQADEEQAAEIFRSLDSALSGLVQSGNIETAKNLLADTGLEVERLEAQLPEYRDALAAADIAQGDAADSAAVANDAWGDTADAADDATESLEDLIDAQREAAGIALDARSAARQYEQALDDAAEALEENGATLDRNTAKGRANESALDDLARAALDQRDAMREADAAAEDIDATMGSAREAFVLTATQMGLTAEEAEGLADDLGLIPDEVSTRADFDSRPAERERRTLMGNYARVPRNITTTVSVDTSNATARLNALKTKIASMGGTVSGPIAYGTFATGGPVFGPGSETSDSIPALLSHNEHVLSAQEVRGMGGHAAVAEMRAMARAGFANGGNFNAVGAAMNTGPSVTVSPSVSTSPMSSGDIAALGDYMIAASQRLARGEIDMTGRRVAGGVR
ncbi:phage tail tape measure protein [Demequina globuliformis]|uniref:phage tail tape measure protein n=1 Tax=Demequina globuliformis TaxID=676202 RepID=UPI000784A88F|nr:phage tail tape measure protein [Demequina globuliformis]